MAALTGLHLRDVQGVTLSCEQLTHDRAILTLYVDSCELMLEFSELTHAKLASIESLRDLPRSEDYAMYLGEARVEAACADQRWLQWHMDQRARALQRALSLRVVR